MDEQDDRPARAGSDRSGGPAEPRSPAAAQPPAAQDPPAAPEEAPEQARGRPLDARLRTWVEERGSATSFVPPSETVVLDARRHPVLLVLPLLRTLAGWAAVVTGAALAPVLVFAVLTGLWARGRMLLGLRRTGLVVLGAALGLVVVDALLGLWLSVLVLLAWGLEDVADWWTDRLVVSDRRVYRRYGVLTRHSPSIALTAVAFLDASVPPLGRLFGYGTLRLDSVAQRDAPLSRFDLLPDVVHLSHEVLRLRSSAMPRFPQQPG